MTTISKAEKDGQLSFSITATHTKKSQVATVFLKFPGEKSMLLSKLLWLFTIERTLPCLMPTTSYIFSAVAGSNSITFTCPDAKVFYAILAIYLYLHKMKIAGAHLKFVPNGESFKKLYERLTNIDITIVGKCKSTSLAISGKAKKYQAFLKSCKAVHDKFKGKIKDDVESKSPLSFTKTFSLSRKPQDQELFNLYLALILGNTNCIVKVSGNQFTLEFLDPSQINWVTICKSSYQQIIKAFLGQFGALGSEPADKDKKKKYQTKVEETLASLNAASQVICGLRGLSAYRFTNAESARTVNKDVLALLKSLHEA